MNQNFPEEDRLGQALFDHFHGRQQTPVKIYSLEAEDDILPVEHYFRSEDEMPPQELLALDRCAGTTLDIGAGAGSHALALQVRGCEVEALDWSPGAVATMQLRGVKHVHEGDFFHWEGKSYDTLLLLMNGIGLAGTLKNLPDFFTQCKRCLRPQGQILLDSSDILHLYSSDGEIWLDLSQGYYGELSYQLEYGNMRSPEFPWLYLDPHSLKEEAADQGFATEILYEGEDGEFLARLTQEDDPSSTSPNDFV